jgi:hypothetical protein
MDLRWLQSWGYSDFFILTQQGKAVGCVPLTALLFEQLLFLSPSRRLPADAAFFRLDFCDHRR